MDGVTGKGNGVCRSPAAWKLAESGAGPARGGRRVPRGPELVSSSLHLGDDVPPSTQELGERTFPPTASAWGRDKAGFTQEPGQRT